MKSIRAILERTLVLATASMLLTACGSDGEPCGEGTRWDGNQCVVGEIPDPELADAGGIMEPTECVGQSFIGPCKILRRFSENGDIGSETTLSYENGLLMRQESLVASDAGWLLGTVIVYSYDAQSRLTLLQHLRQGEPSYQEIYSYAPNGKMIRREELQRYFIGDNQIDWRGGAWTFHYDNDGRLDYDDYDIDDEFDNQHSRRNFKYDDDGQLVRLEYDIDRDGEIDATENYIYDEQGLRIRQDDDDDGDGETNTVTQMSYDLRGNLVRSETDWPDFDAGGLVPDGVIDNRFEYSYDAACNPLEKRWDGNGAGSDGQVDEIIEYGYECWGG